MSTHPYFVKKARQVFEQLKGDPNNSGALASWAESAKHSNNPPAGVLVAEDGEIIANTVRAEIAFNGPVAFYVSPEDTKRLGLFANEVGMACGSLGYKLGKKVVHVRYRDVCTGPAPKDVTPEGKS